MNEAVLDAALAPRILLDGVPIGIALEAWVRGVPDDHPRRAEGALRLAELLRPVDPDRALTWLDGLHGVDEGRLAAARAFCHLERAELERAEEHIAQLTPGPTRQLLEARAALLRGDLGAGIAGLEAVADNTEAAPDLRAEALSFLARAQASGGGDGFAALARLEALCIEQKATITGVWIGVIQGIVRSKGWQGMGRMFAGLELALLLAECVEGLDVDLASLGPVPVWVHGAFKRQKDNPKKLVETLSLITAMMWRLGSEDEAFRTAVFAEKIAARLVPRAAGDLAHMTGLLRRQAGEEKWAEMLAKLEG